MTKDLIYQYDIRIQAYDNREYTNCPTVVSQVHTSQADENSEHDANINQSLFICVEKQPGTKFDMGRKKMNLMHKYL